MHNIENVHTDSAHDLLLLQGRQEYVMRAGCSIQYRELMVSDQFINGPECWCLFAGGDLVDGNIIVIIIVIIFLIDCCRIPSLSSSIKPAPRAIVIFRAFSIK